ncbi:hypothetical protein E6O75_ATG07483 [Venturia nashicola]|uniref:PARP catalytic domain-containing protein n=1 Tax=Venturia nashicola TaxID=86259 RepID=A0A4Z1P1H8_9PEZI|nr:hypothetical protein E6O75_ATG07483 [Venturia nashicola]
MAWEIIKRSLSSLLLEESFEKQILRIANRLHPSDTAFPWEQLNACVGIFIRKQKNINVHSGIEELLLYLINQCSSKDIALAACADMLSSHTIEGLLNEFKPALGSISGLQSYIHILLAVNHHQTQIVNGDEAKCAQIVLQLLSQPTHDPVDLLQPLASLIKGGVPRNSHLADHLDTLVRQSSSILSTRMETLKSNADWFAAHKQTSWLHDDFKVVANQSNIRPDDLSIVDIFDETFPSWSSWAAWEPNERAIQAYALHLSTLPHDKFLIRDLLALEGPDFEIRDRFRRIHYSTMREQLSAVNRTKLVHRCGAIKFDLFGSRPNHVRATLDALSGLVFDVCTKDTVKHDNCRMLLLQQICLSESINEERLWLLEAAFATGSTAVISAVREVKIAEKEGREPDAEVVSTLFKAMEWDASIELRRLLGEFVVASMCKYLEKAQRTLKTIVDVNRNWTFSDLQLLEALQSFGEVCGMSPKLNRHFPEQSRMTLERWPAKWEVQECYQIILLTQDNILTSTKWLTTQVKTYLLYRLVSPWLISVETQSAKLATRLIESLLHLWRKTQDHDRRSMALMAAQSDAISDDCLRLKCIHQLGFIEDGFSKILKFLVENCQSNLAGEACVSFARALTLEEDLIETWRFPLRLVITEESEKLEKWALQTLDVGSWINWIDDVGRIFPDMIHAIGEDSPFFLTGDLHRWALTLRSNLATLKRLESRDWMRHSDAMACMLKGGDIRLCHELERIIKFLDVACEEVKWDTFVALVARLDRNGQNAETIRTAIFQVSMATVPGVEACLHILESYEEVSLQVAETMLACWLNEEDMMDRDCLALEAVALVLGMDAEGPGEPTLDSLEATHVHLDEQFRALIAEAVRLEGLRIAFKIKDPNGTALILDEVGVEDSFLLDDILSSLPSDLIDVVERISDHEVELQLPLTRLTALQKKAIGSGSAQSLLVRFSPGFNGLPPNFCFHWDNEPKELAIAGHSPCLAFPFLEPEHSCHGRPSPGVYQLSRIFSRHLINNGFTSIQDVYKFLVSEMSILYTKCLVCAIPHAYNMRRSTVCKDPQCLKTYKTLHLDVRVADIRHDPAVVDLLLTMVHASASANTANMLLLPDCPITSMPIIKQRIDSLPNIASLQDARDIDTSIGTAAEILSWALTSYRGFLVSATTNLKIPSFPGTHQFLLANASPQLEMDFDAKYKLYRNTRVVFHGTTMERMYAILSQGLQSLSGTPLQRHGYAYGKGIYVSTEPSTAWQYTQLSGASWQNSNFGHQRVLLACELTGHWTTASGNIMRVMDPACLMVRYVFLMADSATVPVSQHVVPALGSVFAGLRRGAL